MRLPLVVRALFWACFFATACGRWVPAKDYVTKTQSDPALAYAKVLKVLADKGYHVLEQRDAERRVKVRSHIDENFVARNSFITATVDASGGVKLTPSGYLVRDGKLHKKLDDELTDLEYALRIGGPARAPAPSVPAPAPAPETSATAVARDAPPAAPPVSALPIATSAPKPSVPAHVKSSPTKATTSTASKSSAPPAPKAKPKTKADDDWVTVH